MGKLLRFPHPTVLALNYYIDGEDTPKDHKIVRQHLKNCAQCETKVRQLRAVDNLFKR